MAPIVTSIVIIMMIIIILYYNAVNSSSENSIFLQNISSTPIRMNAERNNNIIIIVIVIFVIIIILCYIIIIVIIIIYYYDIVSVAWCVPALTAVNNRSASDKPFRRSVATQFRIIYILCTIMHTYIIWYYYTKINRFGWPKGRGDGRVYIYIDIYTRSKVPETYLWRFGVARNPIQPYRNVRFPVRMGCMYIYIFTPLLCTKSEINSDYTFFTDRGAIVNYRRRFAVIVRQFF